MSRIGKLPIYIPNDVFINYENSTILIKGKFGILKLGIPSVFTIEKKKNKLLLNLKQNTKKTRALQGLYRTLLNNMIIGVSQQFQLILLLKGIGYRALIENNNLILNLGYSHPIKLKIPNNILVEIEQNNILKLRSCNKELLGLFISKIRTWRKPEPYKGKGILFKDEKIIRKAGKSGK
uniref:Ribosomal protein L6 n=1 Tax=Astrosyne radiata TaxID=1158023 RepID=A0A2U9NT98_9STRA|nr:ribosomal protein L6 [Astrosyne radiata]AWT40363.1 ribosomal protein L6 [Astrosyne radiata]